MGLVLWVCVKDALVSGTAFSFLRSLSHFSWHQANLRKPGKKVTSYSVSSLAYQLTILPAPPNIPDSLSGPTPAGPRRGFPLESDGGLQIAPALLVVVGLGEGRLAIGFLVIPTSGGGG